MGKSSSANNLPKTEKVYSVLELNTVVRDLIRLEFPDCVWVCGEIQGLRPERNKKHTYFELVQKHPEADEIIAKVRIALFSNRKPAIYERLRQSQATFELKNDIEVKLLCEVSLHAPTGQLVHRLDNALIGKHRLHVLRHVTRDGRPNRSLLQGFDQILKADNPYELATLQDRGARDALEAENLLQPAH